MKKWKWVSSALTLGLLTLPAFAEDMKTEAAKAMVGQAVDQAKDQAVERAADRVNEAIAGNGGEAAGAQPSAEIPPMTPEQQAMMEAWEKAATPGAQHAQLARHFVGAWTTRQSMWMEPAGEPLVQAGKATSTALFDNRSFRMDYEGEFMGQPFRGINYTGYDNVTGKYYSTWVDNMSTGFAIAHGDYDESSQTYTFRGEMPDPMKPGTSISIRETVRIVDADHHVFEMYEMHDGQEVRTMMIEYTRTK